MMADDEAGVLDRMLHTRSVVMEPLISDYGGRIVKNTGDGLLVEFVSVTQAVRCALAIQKRLKAAQTSSVELPALQVRIGINLGEVIVDDDDIYGNGVNVAARVEALAAPGGIACTSAVRDHLQDSKDIDFEDAGEVDVKNIPHPVRIFHIMQSGGENAPLPALPSTRRSMRNVQVIVGLACVVLALTFLAYWQTVGRQENPNTDASVEGMAFDKPSIIVMPFENLSGDPEQEYFSDGMTNNLITDLSRISELLVLARNTSFSFRDRGESTDPRSVGDALGVRYVVEGSIQRAASRVRINASLTDAKTGIQLWAHRYDREFRDLFALQDDTAAGIIEALEIELTEEERRQLSKRYTSSLEAYDLYLRAWEEIFRFNSSGRLESQQYLRDALALDPKFALARALLATSYTNRSGDTLQNNELMLHHALELAEQAREDDPDLPAVQATLGLVHMFRREFKAAEEAFSKAIAMDPNYADAYAMQSWNRHYAGEPEKALEGFQYALVLNPRAPFPYLNALAEVHFSLGNYDTSVQFNLEATRRNPEALRNRLFLAAAYSEMGRMEDASWEIQEALALQPELKIASLEYIAPYRDQTTADKLANALRAAGLPE